MLSLKLVSRKSSDMSVILLVSHVLGCPCLDLECCPCSIHALIHSFNSSFVCGCGDTTTAGGVAFATDREEEEDAGEEEDAEEEEATISASSSASI